MTVVQLDRIGKSYGAFKAVEEFDLTIQDGEFLVLLGPSGCGKSTTLRMIAGLESISTGTLSIGGNPMNDVEPKDRGVAMVFQNYALYPHKSVYDNMAMALKLQKMPKSEIQKRVGDTADMLGLTDYLERKPAALSGGQRQRVAIGRAIVRTPKVFLFDEPLSNLDAKLRVKMRMELQELHDRLGVTSVYVTHDQIEAMTLADRIMIMNGGVVAQVGSPREVYDTPADEFVAGFIGSPSMNFIDIYRTDTGGWAAEAGGLGFADLPFDTGSRQHLRLGIRPEHVEIVEQGAGSPADLEAKVQLAELLGADALLNLDIGATRLLARVGGTGHPSQGETLSVRLPSDQFHAFDPVSGRALRHVAGLARV
ncbi:sn-glycerol-3-phosphate ABC transporter ATP-binding protein UgpC [Tropicimonas sp. TH_r6]|uniref:ABC transporter ATP-binding protein n=1 Tax=Tropicimonas sp. TH_r6 TaxID=3082085 RepID=UPI0029536FF6|nr:sn-glycerol-3-phosphate ABC transporter ATP-binding protein UgpC [Tropicimonas sp. TH_r6]MDV7145715.1 sn-glycerol-3-phosphate ABC transporter ATP-binding protein UgpC [Tropicimonas sp. TH_r6]